VAEARGEEFLALLGTLATLDLCLAKEVGELGVALAFRVLDVDLEAQGVAETRLGEPNDVVIL
jgi:hypothetical protein